MTFRTMRLWSMLMLVLVSYASAVGAAQKAPDREAQGRALVTMLTKGDYAGVVKTFDEQVKKALPEAKVKEVWTQVLAQAGAFQKQESAKVEKLTQDGKTYEVVVVNCQMAKAKIGVTIAYDPAGKVGGLFFGPGK